MAVFFLYWVIGYQNSTNAIVSQSYKELKKYRVPTIEHLEHYQNDSAMLNRFNAEGKEIVKEYVGQFGIPEILRKDTYGSITRTFNSQLDKF